MLCAQVALYNAQETSETPWLESQTLNNSRRLTNMQVNLNSSEKSYLCTFRPEYALFVQNVWSWIDFSAYAGAPAPLNLIASVLLVYRARRHGKGGHKALNLSRMRIQLAVKNLVFLLTVLPGAFLRLRRQLFCVPLANGGESPCLAHLGILADNVFANDVIKLLIVINHASTLFVFVLVDTLVRKKVKSAVNSFSALLNRLDCTKKTKQAVRSRQQPLPLVAMVTDSACECMASCSSGLGSPLRNHDVTQFATESNRLVNQSVASDGANLETSVRSVATS